MDDLRPNALAASCKAAHCTAQPAGPAPASVRARIVARSSHDNKTIPGRPRQLQVRENKLIGDAGTPRLDLGIRIRKVRVIQGSCTAIGSHAELAPGEPLAIR